MFFLHFEESFLLVSTLHEVIFYNIFKAGSGPDPHLKVTAGSGSAENE